MDTQFVRVIFDIDCKWQGIPPIYRIYINNELFTERTWHWTEHYLQEMLQLQVSPGDYYLDLEVIQPSLSRFKINNHQVTHGTATWLDSHILRVSSE